MTGRPLIVFAATAVSWCLLGADCGGLVGGGSTPTPLATPTPGFSGQPVAVGAPMKSVTGLSLTVTQVQHPAGTGLPLANGTACAQLSLSFDNPTQTDWQAPLDDLFVEVAGTPGQKYTGNSATCGNAYNVSDVPPGAHITAQVSFQVPASGSLVLDWTPAPGEEYQTKLS